MPLLKGTFPVELDPRDYSYHLTFGTVVEPLENLEYNLDIGKTMPDQNAEGWPFGCTGYTQSEISGDEDNLIYKPDFTYKKTAFIEGHETDKGCDIRNSIRSTRVYGVQRVGETKDEEALRHRRGQYFNVYTDAGHDWFDSLRAAMRKEKKPLSIGTPYFKEWLWNVSGILTSQFAYSGNPWDYTWHNYKICGEKVMDGVPYLIGKTWQGASFGDHGWTYFPREAVNRMMEIRGSVAFVFAKATEEDLRSIKLDILEYILLFAYRILGLTRLA